MSCEERHRITIRRLLDLAHCFRYDADTIIHVGQGRHAHRSRRGSHADDLSALTQIHEAIRDALQIRGHADHTIPSWVRVLLSVLLHEQGTGNRNALLTLLLLTGGWDAVTPQITGGDMQWLQKVQTIGVPIPPALADRVHLYPYGTIGSSVPFPDRYGATLATILEALPSIDTIPPELGRTVTPRHVMRFLLDEPCASVTDLTCVLRAVMENASVVRRTVTQLKKLGWTPTMSVGGHLGTLLRRASTTSTRSLAQAGMDILLAHAHQQLLTVTGAARDLTTVPDSSLVILESISQFRGPKRSDNMWKMTSALTTLCAHWRTYGRNNEIATVKETLDRHRHDRWARYVSRTLLLAGVIDPPYGDTLLQHLYLFNYNGGYTAWYEMISGAIYAAACQRAGYRPAINLTSISTALHHRWHNDTKRYWPVPHLTLAVGWEQEMMRTASRLIDNSAQWALFAYDWIDTMDALALAGGDPRGFQDALIDALTMRNDPGDPLIIARLAASPHGQYVLDHLQRGETLPPWDTWENLYFLMVRFIPHLGSPHWAMTSAPRRAWWEQTITQIGRLSAGDYLTNLPPLYRAIPPSVALAHPTPFLITAALRHPQWETVPTAARRKALLAVCTAMTPMDIAMAVSTATTDAARRDVLTVASPLSHLSDDQKGGIRELADSEAQ